MEVFRTVRLPYQTVERLQLGATVIACLALLVLAVVQLGLYADRMGWGLYRQFFGPAAEAEFERVMAGGFRLPPERKIERFGWRPRPAGGEMFAIFRLPDSRPAESWLQRIASENKLDRTNYARLGYDSNRRVYYYHWSSP